jgi:hypothetical protein
VVDEEKARESGKEEVRADQEEVGVEEERIRKRGSEGGKGEGKKAFTLSANQSVRNPTAAPPRARDHHGSHTSHTPI